MNYDNVEALKRMYGGIDFATAGRDFAVLMRATTEATEAMGKFADEVNGVWVLVKDEDVRPLVLVAAQPEVESYFRCPRRRDED